MNEEETFTDYTVNISMLSMTDKRISLQKVRKRTAAIRQTARRKEKPSE